MKKFLFLFTLILATNSFGQFNTDREAYLSLLQKLQKDPKRIYELPEKPNTSSEASSYVNFKYINGEEKLIYLKISHIGSNNIQNPNTDSKTIDITNEIKQFNLSESLVISANANFKTTGFKNTYQIDFNELSNLINLTTFSFKGNISQSVELQVINLNKINNLNNLNTLGLHSLKIDGEVYSTLESTTQYKIKDFSISPFKQNNEYITNFNFSSFKNSLEKLTIEDFEGNLNNNFFNNLPNLKSFTHIGRFETFPTDLKNSKNLEELTLESSYYFSTVPTQISDLINLKSLTIRTSQTQLPSTFSDLKNLKKIIISLNSLKGIEPVTNLINLEDLQISFLESDNVSLDFKNMINLKNLDFRISGGNLVNFNPENYTDPLNIDKLINLEKLSLSINDKTIQIENLKFLNYLLVEYINDLTFPKVDFSKNTNIEFLVFDRLAGDVFIENLKTSRIKFDKDFEKLTKLSYIAFSYVPIEMDVTNKFNNLFNGTLYSPKFLGFEALNSPIQNKLDGVLNLCNNYNLHVYIEGSSPKIIDYRNKDLTKSYFSLILKENNNPLIIVDDIAKFKQQNGETYYNSLTNTDIPYNLTTSTEPCERTLLTNNLTKSDVKIYPNPVVDVLNIETDTNRNSIKIIDLTGKIIDSYSINEKKISLQVNLYPKGIYIVEVENEKGKTISKFIKK